MFLLQEEINPYIIWAKKLLLRLPYTCSEVICDQNMSWENNRFNIQIWTCQDDRN